MAIFPCGVEYILVIHAFYKLLLLFSHYELQHAKLP